MTTRPAQPSLAPTLSLLLLVAALAGCQSLAPGDRQQISHGNLSSSPSSMDFGKVIVGQSASLPGTMRATGATINISSVSTTNPEFTVSGVSLPASLEAGQSLPFTVVFTPKSSGSASATLSFLSNADNSRAEQSESGIGTNPPQHRVDLSWNESQSAGVVGYNVYRGTGGTYSRMNDTLEASTAYTDREVEAGTNYFYVVTAVDDNGAESAYSESVTALVPSP